MLQGKHNLAGYAISEPKICRKKNAEHLGILVNVRHREVIFSCKNSRVALKQSTDNYEQSWSMDTITPSNRSALMRRIRSKNTRPELAVRSMLHRLGYRFRLHRKDLPGCPDIVLPKHRKIIFVQGCFWHGHSCRLGSKPKSNENYWNAKIQTNRARDKRNIETLERQGWSVLELWECDIRKIEGVKEKIEAFMRS